MALNTPFQTPFTTEDNYVTDPWIGWIRAITSQGATGATGITALTGNVTATGPGSAVATIANDAVTYAKMQNVSAASRLLGRGSAAGSGDVQEISLGSGISMSGTTLTATATSVGGYPAALGHARV